MKDLKKISMIAFLALFVLQMFCLVFVLMKPYAVMADTGWTKESCQEAYQSNEQTFNESTDWVESSKTCFTPRAKLKLQVPFGRFGSTETDIDISSYIAELYKYLIGIAGILATVMIMFGAFKWLMAAGNPQSIGDSKEYIGSAILGLFLILLSYTLLHTINPNLVSLNWQRPEMIKTVELETNSGTGNGTGKRSSIDFSCSETAPHLLTLALAEVQRQQCADICGGDDRIEAFELSTDPVMAVYCCGCIEGCTEEQAAIPDNVEEGEREGWCLNHCTRTHTGYRVLGADPVCCECINERPDETD